MEKTERIDPMRDVKLSQKLTESGLMIALGTILSVLKIMELPYGGSITLASMLPLIIIAYRYGFVWGMLTGFVFGVIQMILGMNNVSYATSFIAAVAIILLDYVLAFMSTSLGGLFRQMKKPAVGFGAAALLVCFIRYTFHVISGCTVWAGLSIPTVDAFFYSLIYNGTYMLPETIITFVAAVYVATVIDFSNPRLKAAKSERTSMTAHILNAVSGLIFFGAVVTCVAMVFPHLQNAESGEFDITGISGVNTTVLIIVCAVALVAICALQIVKASVSKSSQASNE